jgi:glycerol kinase
MGIHALLTTIAPIRETVTVWRRCKGANVGVDAFGWLHQLAMNHYEELVVQQPRSCRGVVQDLVAELLPMCRCAVPYEYMYS